MDELRLQKTFAERIQERGFEPVVLYVSSAVYTGDGSVNQVIFQTEEDAKIDCKINFENSVAEGEKNGDMESNSGWDEETSSGAIYWYGGDTSTFEVKAVNYFTVKQTNETLAAEQDFFAVQCRLLKDALIKAGYNAIVDFFSYDAIVDFFDFEYKDFEDDAQFNSKYKEVVAKMPRCVFDAYYKTYVFDKQVEKLIPIFFNTRNEEIINELISKMSAEDINEYYDRYIVKKPAEQTHADDCDFVLEIYSRKTNNFIEQVIVDPVLNDILGYAKKNPIEDDMKYVVKRNNYKIDDNGNLETYLGTTILYDDLVKSLV